MRRALVFLLLLTTGGCASWPRLVRDLRPRRVERWAPSIACYPPIQASLRRPHESRGHLIDDQVTVYGYAQKVRLHYSLRDATLAELLDASGGLPRFGGPGRTHLGTVRADVRLPGGEGYRFDFRNWRRRDALALLADVTGKAIIVGPDVEDVIDVEVTGAPPIAVLRLLADEGGVVILEDDF